MAKYICIKLKSYQIHLASKLQRVNMVINFIKQVIPEVEYVIFFSRLVLSLWWCFEHARVEWATGAEVNLD